MKTRLLIAAAVGALISATLLVLEPLTDYALLSWELPGISAAYLFRGAVGGGTFPGIAIAWFVNAVVYGAAAFAILMLLKVLTPALPR